MRDIDLRISDELIEYLQGTIDINPSSGNEMAIFKGQVNDAGPDVWCMSVVPADIAEQIKVEPDSYINAKGLAVLVSPSNLAEELNGKYMDWGDDGVSLIDQA